MSRVERKLSRSWYGAAGGGGTASRRTALAVSETSATVGDPTPWVVVGGAVTCVVDGGAGVAGALSGQQHAENARVSQWEANGQVAAGG
jgi:hypothetical protein